MAAAQILILKNVVRAGETLSLNWASGGSGLKYTLRYTFGSLSGTIKSDLSYNVYSWTLPDSFTEEKSGISVFDGTVYLDTYSGNTLVGTTSATFTVADSDIIIPELSSYSISLGDTVTLTLERRSLIYDYRNFKYTFGTLSGNLYVSWPTYGNTASKEWNMDLSLGMGMPEAVSGVLEIRCDTYSNFSSAIIGSVTLRVLVQIPENDATKPAVNLTLEPVNGLDSAFDGLYIRGKSKVKATLEASSTCSNIVSRQLTALGSTKSENVYGTEATFEFSGDSLTVNGYAEDARGYSAFALKTVTAIAYSKPSVVPASGETEVICDRCLADGTVSSRGQHLLIRAKRRYTTIESGGEQLNKCVLRYRYKTASAEDYSAWVTLLDEDAEESEVSVVLEDVQLNIKTAYTVQIGVLDTVGEFHNVTVPVHAAVIPLHLGLKGRNIAVGQYCDYSHTDAFDIGFTSYFNTGAAKQAVFADGSWTAGEELSAVAADADMTGLGTYNLFIAVAGGSPVLCVKAGNVICGGAIRMTYAETDGIGTLTLESTDDPVTALYKLL